VFLGNISQFLSAPFLFFLVSCFASVEGITRSRPMLSSCLTQGPSYGDALDQGKVSSFWLPSPHQFSLSLVVSTHILPPKVLEQYFCHEMQSDWTVTRVCNWSFFVISFRLLTVVKSSIGQGTRICSNPSQVVTCFVGFIIMVLNIKVQFWFITIWFSNIWEVKLRPAKPRVVFEVFETPNWIQSFYIRKIQEPATDGFLTKWNTCPTLV